MNHRIIIATNCLQLNIHVELSLSSLLSMTHRTTGVYSCLSPPLLHLLSTLFTSTPAQHLSKSFPETNLPFRSPPLGNSFRFPGCSCPSHAQPSPCSFSRRLLHVLLRRSHFLNLGATAPKTHANSNRLPQLPPQEAQVRRGPSQLRHVSPPRRALRMGPQDYLSRRERPGPRWEAPVHAEDGEEAGAEGV